MSVSPDVSPGVSPDVSPGASIERSVVRAYLVSIVGVATAIVGVGALMTTYVVVKRDDSNATALAQTMAAELTAHEHDAGLDQLVREELDEQRWFHREIEVWRNGTRLGVTSPGRLGRWQELDSCATGNLDGATTRLCTVKAGALRIVVATALLPIILAELPLVLAIALVAAMAVLAFSLLSRRLVRRSLRPLRRFEERLAGLPALVAGPGDRVASEWGATEIDQLARTFNALLGRIDEALLREHRFVSNAAHELRTPLTRLRGQIELVLAEAQSSPESERRLTLAVQTCEQLARSTDALVALAGDQLGREDAVELGDLVTELRDGLPTSDQARIQLTITEGTDGVVRGDEVLLTLAARNLVDNALKYSAGAIELRVEANCTIAVLDAGPGIPAGELQSVRQPFVRGHGTEVRGTGLGLALADHVATLHGGHLTLENRPIGLRAALTLPPWTPR